ncbi:hypothetical protein EJ076_08450 [Mesorhizobium sp. M7D.F.Ca.US.005.01.1.1]|nr:hypothetical protein EJ076_08450 [Mesorhizobium sp. M7D.F.Ca.US.005.01.1.1]
MTRSSIPVWAPVFSIRTLVPRWTGLKQPSASRAAWWSAMPRADLFTPRCGSATATSSSIPKWADYVASPASVSGKNTQSVYVRLKDSIDAHCEQARAAGADIIQEPTDQFYGERQYRARDPEGHVWTFTLTLRSVPREEAERLGGVQIDGWHR